VTGGFLNISQWHTGIECGRDKCVAKRVRSNSFRDAGTTGDATHNARRSVTVEPLPIRSNEERGFAALADREVEGACGAQCERNRHDFATLSQNRECAVAALEPEGFDIGAEGLGDPQAFSANRLMSA
jgi:hypothetical protein